MKRLEISEESVLTKKLLDLNKNRVAELDSDLANIEEKYKKLMEDETSAIVREKTQRLATIETLEKLIANCESSDAPVKASSKKEKAEEKPTEPEKANDEEEKKEEEKEPVIQDTLFPENNVEPDDEEEKPADETPTENPQQEESTQDAQTEIPIEEIIPSTDASGFEFPESENNQDETEKPDDDEDDWPAMPQEWQQ